MTRGRGEAIPGQVGAVGDAWDEAGQDVTLFSRTMTIEAPRDAPLPDKFFQQANPARIDAYHEPVARELDKIDISGRGA